MDESKRVEIFFKSGISTVFLFKELEFVIENAKITNIKWVMADSSPNRIEFIDPASIDLILQVGVN